MTLHRRQFLRAAGVSLALPCLDVLAADAQPRRRMVCICTPLGLHPPAFFPDKAGKDYPLSPYLEVLKDLRDDFTVMSSSGETMLVRYWAQYDADGKPKCADFADDGRSGQAGHRQSDARAFCAAQG